MKGSTGGIQHGGNHYLDMGIQPIDYAEENGLTPTEFSIIKYVSRHRRKGKLDDLKKALHFMQMLARQHYDCEVAVSYMSSAEEGDK